MSRMAIAGIVITCLMVGILIGIFAIPGSSVENEKQKAVKSGVDNVIKGAVQNAAHDEANKIAKALLDADKRRASPPSIDVAPAAEPIQVDRETFSITLPPACKVDPKQPGVDGEHRASWDVRPHGMMYIVAIDDKTSAAAAFDDALRRFREDVQHAEVENPDLFDSIKTLRATGVRGHTYPKDDKPSVEVVYQLALCEGWDKAYIFIAEYPQEDKSQYAPTIRKALATFKMKG